MCVTILVIPLLCDACVHTRTLPYEHSECSVHAGDGESTFESTIGSTTGATGPSAPTDSPSVTQQQQPTDQQQVQFQQYHPSSQMSADTQIRDGSTVSPSTHPLGVQQPGPPEQQHPGPPDYQQQQQLQHMLQPGGQGQSSVLAQEHMLQQGGAQDHQLVTSEHTPDPQPQVSSVVACVTDLCTHHGQSRRLIIGRLLCLTWNVLVL